jgi:hypothetical protein
LAALLAAGSDRYVDFAYIAIELAFVFLGAFWLSRYAQELAARGESKGPGENGGLTPFSRQSGIEDTQPRVKRKWLSVPIFGEHDFCRGLPGLHAVCGFAFLLVPAVLVSLDRMTVDLPLAALCIGLARHGARNDQAPGHHRWPVYAILAAAPLVRETGMVLVIAWCAHALLRRDGRAAGLGACCAVPALGWWAYVHGHTPPDGTPWLSRYPFSGIIERTVQGIHHPDFTPWLRTAALLEEAAIAGIWLALLAAFYLVWKRRWGLIELTCIAFAIFAAFLGKFDIWSSAYATGRTMSPLLILLGLLALRDRRWVFALPLLLVLPRIALQYEAQLKGALRGIF